MTAHSDAAAAGPEQYGSGPAACQGPELSGRETIRIL